MTSLATPVPPTAEARVHPLGRRGHRPGETAVVWLLRACALATVATTVGIIAVLLGDAWSFFREVSPVEFFTGTEWSALFSNPKFGVLPLLSGTFLVTAGAIVVGLPLGLAAAIYLSEYAPRRVRAILKPLLEVLAGIPTVVFGYFALNFVTPHVLRPLFGERVFVFNAASAGIVVGLMVLPTISSLSEDAMSAVPASLREAAYALGARKRTVALRVVVPSALSGVAAATVLAVSRAMGETMAVTIAAGNTPNLTFNPLRSIQTMTAFIAQVASGDAPAGSPEYRAVFAVGLTLFLLTFFLNGVSQRLVRRYRQAYA